MKTLPKSVWLLGWVSLLNDASSEVIAAVLPLYLAQIGATGLGVGLIGGLEEATRSLLSLASGYGADRAKRRRPFLVTGYGLSALAKAAIGLAASWVQVLGLRMLDRAGKALRTPPRDALIATVVASEIRGLAFGVHRAMDTAGALLGSLAALVAVWVFGVTDFRLLIVLGGLLGFASLVPLWALKEPAAATVKKARLTLRGSLSALPSAFYRTLLALSLFALGNVSYLFFLLAVNDAFQDRLALGLPLLMYVIFNVSNATLSIPLGRLSDRWGRSGVVAGGYVLFSLVCAGFAVAQSVVAFVALFLLYGAAIAALEGAQRALVADVVPEGQRGLALGVFHTTVGVCGLLGNGLAGWFWQTVGPGAAFAWAAAFTLCASLALGWQMRTGPSAS